MVRKVMHAFADECKYMQVILKGNCTRWIPLPRKYVKLVIEYLDLIKETNCLNLDFNMIHFEARKVLQSQPVFQQSILKDIGMKLGINVFDKIKEKEIEHQYNLEL